MGLAAAEFADEDAAAAAEDAGLVTLSFLAFEVEIADGFAGAPATYPDFTP